MTSTSQATAAARETARTTTGQFGIQEHTTPEMSLTSGVTYTEATGPEVNVISIATGDGYEQFTVAEARKHLNIPDSEDEATVLAVAELLSKSAGVPESTEDYPPFVSQEPTYDNPGEDGTISAEHWHAPAAGVTWEKDVPTWSSDDGRFYMMPAAVLDPQHYGYPAEHSEAFQVIVADYAAKNSILDSDCTTMADDGKLRVHMAVGFEGHEYVPRVVERRYAEMFADIDPTEFLAEIKDNGVVLSNTALFDSSQVQNARAIAYAAANGRAPSDAEALAILREFRVTSTLRDGYLHTEEGSLGTVSDRTPEADNATAITALNAWFRARQGKKS